jgi:hypothetical protein
MRLLAAATSSRHPDCFIRRGRHSTVRPAPGVDFMYETDQALGLGFDEETRKRMRAVFGAEVCVRCGAPAERLSANEFFCGLHYPDRHRREERSPRVYQCSAS